ncbi:hypothetical protein GOP47_0029825 [Adiantum capillus-veneris]|nr:hypothetical protein GOP47_0029825 [Adiantum capillus-veneris]
MRQGHYIKDCLDLKPHYPPKETSYENKDCLQRMQKRNSAKSSKNPKPTMNRNKNSFSPLLQEVFDPFSYDLQEEDANKIEQPEDQPNLMVRRWMMSHLLTPSSKLNNEQAQKISTLLGSPMSQARGLSSAKSLDSEEASVPNTQFKGKSKSFLNLNFRSMTT